MVAGSMEEMVAGLGRARERDGPAQGPGLQMTPVCRPNVQVLRRWSKVNLDVYKYMP